MAPTTIPEREGSVTTFFRRGLPLFGAFALLTVVSQRAEARVAVPNIQPHLALAGSSGVAMRQPVAVLAEIVLVPKAWPVDWHPTPPIVVQADSLAASCMVRQILASQTPGGVDPKLQFLKGQLSKEPFKGYKSFKLLAENELALANRQPGKLTLLTKQDLGLAYKEKLSVAGGKARMRMHLTLTNAEKQTILDTLYAIDEGGTLLQAGMPFQEGTFVLALTCRTK